MPQPGRIPASKNPGLKAKGKPVAPNSREINIHKPNALGWAGKGAEPATPKDTASYLRNWTTNSRGPRNGEDHGPNKGGTGT